MRPWSDHLPPDRPLGTDDLTLAGTLLGRWTQWWRSDPDAPLWWDGAGQHPVSGGAPSDPPSGADRWVRAGVFDEATRRVAGRLSGAGLSPGDRVVWSTGSSVAALVAHVGALRAGLVVVPVNRAYGQREVAHVVTDVRPAAAIVERPEMAEWISSASPGPVLVLGPEVALADGPPAGLDAAGPDDPALILFTSGTTGPPKGAVLRHRNLSAATASVVAAWRWGPTDRLVHCLPVFHAHGLCVGVYGTLTAGASAVLLPGFDPDAVVNAALQQGATLFFGVPTMYHRLLESGRAPELGALRLCVSGSAPLPANLHEEFSACLSAPVLERYGMTETLMNTSNPYDGPRRAGTVGFPLPGVEVCLDDGEILVRGPNVFDGYWERPEADAEVFVAADDGGRPWFRTGDLGADDDGYLVVSGRIKELIISGGFNVSPREVEEVLADHPRVVEAAVTGTPSDEWGEVVTAWIVVDGRAPDVEELAAFVAPSLAPYKRPRLVHVVDALPRNALGKVVRDRLRP